MRRYIFVLLLFVFLSGCGKSAPKMDSPSVVTGIEVAVIREDRSETFHYYQDEKMQAVLSYLRSLNASGYAPIDPDSFRTDAYRFCLTMADGSERVYYQLYDEYLQRDGGPWLCIDEAKASSLPQLLKLIPSDDA